MRWTGILVLTLSVGLPIASGFHDSGTCIPTSADPSTYNAVVALGRHLYVYENTAPIAPIAVPLSGLLLGDGTNIYEESNDLEGLQRHWCHHGGLDLADARTLCLADWFPPGCDQNPDWRPTDGTVPCMLLDDDPIMDETCGHGTDNPIF